MPLNGEIERVIDHRKNPKGPGEQFQVLWKGQNEADATWEAASRIRLQIPLLVQAFEVLQQQQRQEQTSQQRNDAMDTSDHRAEGARKADASAAGVAPDMARMRQQLDEQARLIQQMTAASSTSVGSRFAKAQPRAQELDEYHGAAGVKLDEWLEKLGRTCALYTLNDQETLQFACSRLTGAALQWWNVLPAGDRAAVKDRASLASALRGRFQPITTERVARDQLHSLRQTGDVNAYIAEHQRLSALIPKMDDATALHSFEHGLRGDIAEKLRVHGVSTLNEAITMAARIGGLISVAPTRTSGPSQQGLHPSRLHQMDAMEDTDESAQNQNAMDARLNRLEGLLLNAVSHHSFGSEGPQGGYQGLGAKSQTKRGYQQQSNGGGRSGPPRRGHPFQRRPPPTIPGVPNDIVQRRWDAHQCVRCGESGHQSIACPNPISSSN
jgi:Retrotransposon gag protein/Chromo (CHRromatin Organisation MOdifier) domain